ncbi:MAG: FecR domain-containing protein [Pseudomonadota bacterium]
MRRSALYTTLMASVAALCLPTGASASEIGNVAAVNRDMAGTPPDAQKRLLEIGAAVVQDERIETTELGSGQLLFVDQTSLTVSPNTDIVLDTYVYDPEADSGDVALTMTRGTLRFIGGRISKKRRALVRTPTATIGIRGGMVLIEVRDDGSVKVTHLAGESSTVVSYGDANGDGVDDGPGDGELEPFLEGQPVGSGNNSVTISRASGTAETNPAPGTGTGQQGGTQRRPRAASTVTFTGLTSPDDLQEVYGKLEGNRSGGTQQVPTNQGADQSTQQIAGVNSGVQDGQTRQPVSTSGEQPASDAPPNETPNDPRVAELPTSPETSDPTDILDIVPPPPTGGAPGGGAFFTPGQGFQTFANIELGSIVGTTASGEVVTVDVPVSPGDLLPVIPGTNQGFLAQTRFPDSGFFLLEPGQASSTVSGELVGGGFADLENNFFFIQAENTFSENNLIVFGDATPNQQQAFAQAAGVAAAANEVTRYQVEANFVDAQPEAAQVAIIANGAGGPDAPRILFGSIDIDQNGTSQSESLSVVAGALTRQGQGGPVISTAVLSSTVDTINSDQLTTFEFSRIGSVEDAAGNTLFGPDADYIALSSAFRLGGTGGFVADNPGNGTTISPEFTNVGFQLQPEAALLTRDPEGREVVNNPLSLANDATSRESSLGLLDTAYATGIADCGARGCNGGQSRFYALTPRTEGETRTPNASLDFAAFGSDQNAVQGAFVFSDNGDSDIPAGQAGGDFFSFTPNANDSAYIDDSRFGIGSAFVPVFVAGNNGGADFVVASSGLVGDAGVLPPGVDAQPQFARWGWWSAFYTSEVQNGVQQFDAVHLGTWVAGIRPDPSDFTAFTGTGSFSGGAVGTHADFAAGTRDSIGGTFTMTYDFGQRAGELALSLPDAGFDRTFAVNSTGNIGDATYAGTISETGLDARVDGAFYSGGGSVVAATGGAFDIQNTIQNTQTVGVIFADID